MSKEKIAIAVPDSVAAERLAESIKSMEAAAKALLSSGLTEEALALLISHAMPAERRLAPKWVALVLRAASGVGAKFLIQKGEG